MKDSIEYWGTGFPVNLIGFPAYEDDGWYRPDVPLKRLELAIARRLIERPYLLTGDQLAFLRASADLSRSEASRKLAVTRRTLINWEDRGKRPIGTTALIHLGLRIRFFAWIFPDESLPASALEMVNAKSLEPITVRYSDLDQSSCRSLPSLQAEPIRLEHQFPLRRAS